MTTTAREIDPMLDDSWKVRDIPDRFTLMVDGEEVTAARVSAPGNPRDRAWDISTWGWCGSVEPSLLFLPPGVEEMFSGRRLRDPDDEPNLSGLEGGGIRVPTIRAAIEYVVRRGEVANP